MRIVFERRGDRYVHVVQSVSAGQPAAVLRSLEGDDRDVWPPSPPLQQLVVEEQARGQRVALAVGMAGTSHWSLSAAVNKPLRQFEFDVACRLSRSPEILQSEYQVLSDARQNDASVLVTTLCGVLQIEPSDDNSVAVHLDHERQRVRIAPRSLHAEHEQRVQTVRWRYRIKVL